LLPEKNGQNSEKAEEMQFFPQKGLLFGGFVLYYFSIIEILQKNK
jgi:hypothetical protein